MPSQLATTQEINTFVGQVDVPPETLDDAVTFSDSTIIRYFGAHPVIDTINDTPAVQATKRAEIERRKWGLFRLTLLNIQARDTGSPIFDNTGLVDATRYDESQWDILNMIGMIPTFLEETDAQSG